MILIFRDMKSKYSWLAKNEKKYRLSGRVSEKSTKIRNTFIKTNILEELKRNNLNNKDSILVDVGCGDGSLASQLKRFFRKVIFTVLTKEEEGVLKSKKGGGKENILVCNSHDIPLNDNSVDFIICNSVLHSHEIDLKSSVLEFSRILKHGGILYIGEIRTKNTIKILDVKHPFDYLLKGSKIYGSRFFFITGFKLFLGKLNIINFIINAMPENWLDKNQFSELVTEMGFEISSTYTVNEEIGILDFTLKKL